MSTIHDHHVKLYTFFADHAGWCVRDCMSYQAYTEQCAFYNDMCDEDKPFITLSEGIYNGILDNLQHNQERERT